MTLEKRIIDIGGHSVEAWHDDSPKDGFVYDLDLYGDKHDSPLENKFFITYLSQVGCKDLPNNIRLHIYYTQSQFKRVNFIDLQKCGDGPCVMKVTLTIDYQDWEMAESVASFVYRFVDSIKDELAIEVNPNKTEYGYFVECIFEKSDVLDLFKWYLEIEHSLEKIYQKELVNPRVSEPVNQRYGESRLHWWIRYVIVPLIGSGTIAAVIAEYLLR